MNTTWNLKNVKLFSLKLRKSRSLVILFSTILLVSCFKSGSPEVEDLIKLKTPTFNNKNSAIISSPSINYSLTGECDSQAYATEYSIDSDQSWNSTECSNNLFTISLKLNGYVKVAIRSKGKFSYTDTSRVMVRYLLPPTSDTIVATSSSKADSSDLVSAGTQNVMAHTFTGESATAGNTKIDTYLPRLVYETR